MQQQELLDALKNYISISELLKTKSYEEILETVAALGQVKPEELEFSPAGSYSKEQSGGNYRIILRDLLKNVGQYDWVYSHLTDEASRLAFTALTAYRILPLQSLLQAACDGENPQYFDKSIVSRREEEVFVDYGAFTGDTTKEFIRQSGEYKQIYVYESAEENIRKFKNNLKKYSRVSVRRSSLSDNIQTMSLDNDIAEKITFLKISAEGSEASVLTGAKNIFAGIFQSLSVYAMFSAIYGKFQD